PVTNLTSFPMDEKIYLSRAVPGYFLNGKFVTFKIKGSLGIKTNFLRRSNGELYSGGTRFIFINKKDSIVPHAIVAPRISCLVETRDHQLLLGSNLGVFKFDDASGETFLFHKDLNDIRIDDIRIMG